MDKRIKQFQAKILAYYRKHGRDLPWRRTKNPYKILVSEVMLQQTQVARVITKYGQFLKLFPTLQKLAQAGSADVLRAWQGLGYNRRALALHRLARIVAEEHKGKLPRDVASLEKLPGIGPYTARAIAVFAFDQTVPMIETNIRRVFLHEFYKNKKGISDKSILSLIEKSLPTGRQAKEWCYALMDYGAMLGKTVPNPNHRSKHYTRQSKFEGSNRQVRGAIIRILTQRKNLTVIQLARLLHLPLPRTRATLKQLNGEAFVVGAHGRYRLV